ncbi:MAG: InlB B-repeat-containing protein [Treponema sp.]|nr:InlB B-repeat-containing protein [Treponema sp.]
MNKRRLRRFSFGLLGLFVAPACIFIGCAVADDPEPTKYTVTFAVDDGSPVPAQTVEEGEKASKPADPANTGYTFANWYRDEAKTILWSFDKDVVVADTIIYAKWVSGENVPSFTVTFDADGGDPAPAEQSVVQGEPVARPADPTTSGYIFDGWYNGNNKWNFSTDTVTGAITLKAKWTEAVTVTFDANGGSAIEPLTVAKGGNVYPSHYTPSKASNVFDGWYTDAMFATSAEYSLTVTASVTLYAKWTSTSELVQYAGVWRRNSNESYLLQADGTLWEFYYSYLYKNTWTTSQIIGKAIAFNEEKTEFTIENATYTKNTTDTKTPAAATGDLLGVWANSNNQTELKTDKTAVLTSYRDAITLNYCAAANAVYLLQPETNLVIFSIAIQEGNLSGFSKPTSDSTLEGIWKLTEDGQDYYWNLNADGSGTFRTLGASVAFSFTVTEDKKIDGYSYTVSGDTLTLSSQWEEEDIILAKVDSVSSGSGAAGDSRLYGAWEWTREDETMTFTFNSNGSVVVSVDGYSESYIWKAGGGNLYMYYSSFDASDESLPYTVSGSTLTINDAGGPDMLVLTKK